MAFKTLTKTIVALILLASLATTAKLNDTTLNHKPHILLGEAHHFLNGQAAAFLHSLTLIADQEGGCMLGARMTTRNISINRG